MNHLVSKNSFCTRSLTYRPTEPGNPGSLDAFQCVTEIKADTIIAHDQVERISGPMQFDGYFPRLGMAQNVIQCLEGNSETGRLYFRIRPLQIRISNELDLPAGASGIIVQHQT